jgi:UrcA family protein
MYSNKWSDVQCRRNHSTLEAQSVKESVMSISKIVRARAIRMALVMFASVSTGLAAGAARAGEPADTHVSKVVSFRDLNLNSTEGAAVLYNRIKSAATEVCTGGNSYDLSRFHAVQTCINESVSRAVAQVDRPMLTSLYEAKTGKADKKVTTLAKTR